TALGQQLLVDVAGPLGPRLMLRRAVENYRPGLGAGVIALAPAPGRVGGLPEHLQQRVERALGRVVDDPHGFGVPGLARADLLVRGVRRVAVLVADRGGHHARGLPERPLLTPEGTQR